MYSTIIMLHYLAFWGVRVYHRMNIPTLRARITSQFIDSTFSYLGVLLALFPFADVFKKKNTKLPMVWLSL